MNSRVQAYNNSPTGENSVNVYEDISTRSLNTVRIGQSAGKINSGSYNVYAGYESGASALNSSYTTAIGYRAMNASTNALYSTAIGAYAAAQNTSGSETVYIGYKCGEFANEGNQVVAVGAYSMNQNVAAHGSVAIGYRSAERTLDGGYCVFIGAQAGQDNRNSFYSTMAGYQSGRASRGDNNCLFGAYSGYSNIEGNGSCLFGFRSGQNTSGDFNCAFGAYSMQYASGSCNVAIGAFANSSGYNSTESVFVGTNVAGNGSASQSVILGTNAGATAKGSSLVIIGYNAGTGFESGNSNILIGQGASTFIPVNNNGIAIGSINTLTYTNSISIGNDVVNENENSILLGFNLDCDANQSIGVGNNISIQSVELFQDPLIYLYSASVLRDGENKLGLTSINYCNVLISPAPANTIYTIAKASIYTSNIISSETNPPSNTIASSTYNLLTDIPYIVANKYAIITGQCFPIINDINDLTDPNANVNVNTLSFLSNITPIFNGIININLNNYIFIDKIINSFTFPSENNNVTANIRIYNASIVNSEIYIPKSIAPSILNNETNYYSNISSYISPLQSIANNSYFSIDASIIPITYNSSRGLILPTNTTTQSFVINKQPLYGTLNSTSVNNVTSVNNANNYIYKPFVESAFAKDDNLELLSVLNITSNTGLSINCAYGLPSSNIAQFNINYISQSNEIYSANSILLPTLNNPTILNNQIIQSIYDYNTTNSNIVISHIGPTQSIYYVPTQKTFSSVDINAMSNASIWNYTNVNYIPYLQNLLLNIDALIVSNKLITSGILYPLIETMSYNINTNGAGAGVGISNIITYSDTTEVDYYNSFNNSFVSFSNNQIPSTLDSLTTQFNTLFNYSINTAFLSDPYFNNFNTALINYTNIFIGTQFYYMNSNIINTSNIIINDINNTKTYDNSLTYLYTYTSNNIQTYTDYIDALDISSNIYNLYTNYLQVPILLLSYTDFNNNNILLLQNDDTVGAGSGGAGAGGAGAGDDTYIELIISDYNNISYINLNNVPIIKQVYFNTGSNSTWDTITSGFTCNIIVSNNTLIPISLNLPVNVIDNFILQNLPANGIISNNTNSINNANNDYEYLPRNPWAVVDNISVIVTSNTNLLSQSQSALANYTFNNDTSIRIQSPLYIQTPLSYSNITSIFNTTNYITTTISYACNIDVITSYTIDNISQPNLLQTIYTPITNYSDDTGIYINTSNVIITNSLYVENLDISNTDGKLTVTSNLYYSYSTDNINYDTVYSTNIISYDWNESNPFNYKVLSNQYVYYTNTTCNIVFNEISKVYDKTYTYFTQNIYNNTYYDIITDTYIYNDITSNINPYPDIVYSITSNVTINSYITNITSNIDVNSNISYYESFMKLNTNYIWTNNSQNIFNVVNTGLNTGVNNSPIVKQNIGKINQFTMDDINNGYIYVNTSNYSYINNLLVPLNIQLQSQWQSRMQSLSTIKTFQVIPINTPLPLSGTITNLPDTTITIESQSSLGSVTSIIQNARNISITTATSASFVPSYIHLYSFNNTRGSLVLNNLDSRILTLVTRIPISQLNDLYYLAAYKYEKDIFAFFFSDSDSSLTSQLFVVNLNINHTPVTYTQSFTYGITGITSIPNIICSQSWNRGLSFNNPYYLSSNALYNSFNGIQSSDIRYDLDTISIPLWLNIPNSFTQADINNGIVSISINAIENYNIINTIQNTNITYTLTDLSTFPETIVRVKQIFPVATYYFNSYPNPKTTIKSSFDMFGIDNISYSNLLVGEFWNIIKNLNVQNATANPQNISIIVSSLNNGFLWNTNYNNDIQTVFTLDDLLNNSIRYIPFNPNIDTLDTDILVFNISYTDGSLSPIYTINLNPYISRFYQGSVINTGVYSTLTRSILPPVCSKAFVKNNIQWLLRSSSTVEQNCLYNSNINASWALTGFSSDITNFNNYYNQSISAISYSTPIIIINNNITFTLDQSDSVALTPILKNLVFNSNAIYDCYIYILTNPQYGIIQKKSNGTNIIRCDLNDLNNNDIIYQNFGSLQTVDSFIVGVSSTPYDLDLQQITVNVQINPLPIITKNNSTYLYFNNSNSALTNNIIISNNDLNIINKSVYNSSGSSGSSSSSGSSGSSGSSDSGNANTFIHIINSSNINLTSNIYYNNVNFNINSNVIKRGTPYELMYFNYVINNSNTINPLAQIAPYNSIFYNTHNIFLNTYVDSNIILPGQNRTQSINYSIKSSKTNLINQNNHTITLIIDIWPFSSLQNKQLNFLQNYNFNINITDINNKSLLFVDFHKTYVAVYDINKNSNIIPLESSRQLLQTNWNTISIINLDPVNNYGISLKWFDDTNLLLGTSSKLLPIVNANIANISINVDTLNSENYISSSNFTLSSLKRFDELAEYDGTIGASYELYNYYTTHKLKNLQILVSTYANETNIIDTTVNNVVLGNQLTVRGINNICIGDKFTTSGQNSIIIGNKIGSLTLGDIYESIVIGNSCFQNSTLRNVICIGRNNLNVLSLNEDPIKIQNFISQFPIIIGNNIDSTKLDFYINIGNTFLKSSTINTKGITESQVYIGFEKEPVGIGYISNVNLRQDYALNVNGSIIANTINAPTSMVGNVTNVTNVTNGFIPSGYLVSSTGNIDSTGNLIVKMAGLIDVYDRNIIGVSSGSNSIGQTNINIGGYNKVWCDSVVTCGQYLVCSVNNIGVASGYETNIKQNYVFGKSVVNWDPANVIAYPNIVTKTINNVIFGYINCIINI